jgi:hypothetical protein
MVEYHPVLREAANIMDLKFFNGDGSPFISYFPERDLINKLEKANLGPAFNLMTVGFCAMCPLNEKSPKYEKITIEGKLVVCKTLEPCCGATPQTFYTSGSADINAAHADAAHGNSPREERDVFTKLIESKAACLNNNVRTIPHKPLSQR